MNTPHTVLPLLVMSVLLPTAACVSQDPGALLDGVSVSLAQAIEAAQKHAKDGTVVHAEIERDGPRVVFSIDFAQGAKNLGVVLDGKSQEVLEQETDDDDHTRLVAAARVPLPQSIAAAEKLAGGRAIEAQLIWQQERPVARVHVFAKTLQTVLIDAVSGEAVGAAAAAQGNEPKFTETFHVAKDDLASRGKNPFLILEPGHQHTLEGTEDGEPFVLQITVLDETKVVDGVETRVVEERETKGGKLVEISRNFFAISKTTASVYYFGEEVDIYEGEKVVNHEGAWLSGRDGARFGLLLPGTPLVGGRYYQEIAPKVAMDRAEIIAVDEAVKCPAGTFTGCLRTEETTPLEPKERSRKVYAPGVGLVVDGTLQLSGHGRIR